MLAGAFIVLALTIMLMVWKSARDARARDAWSAAISAVVDTTREDGWIETFQTPHTQPLSTFDPRWRHIFGNLIVDSRRAAAIGDPEGGWQRDRGDDYAFRASDIFPGSVNIVMDGWWDGDGSIGVQGAVQLDPPHRLYEAALWRGKLLLLYFYGPRPVDFEILAESPSLDLSSGHYRIILEMDLADGVWRLSASLNDPSDGYAEIARVAAFDNRLDIGAQGIGILGGGASSYVTGIAVRAH